MTVIFEGPALMITPEMSSSHGPEKMQGWRHVRRISSDGTDICLLTRATLDVLAGCADRVYPLGTWEDRTRDVQPGKMPWPRKEILDEIGGAS